MQSAQVDRRLAYHIGALFERSPVPAYERELEFPDEYSRYIEHMRQKKEAQDNSPSKFSDAEITSEESKSLHSLCEREQEREGVECAEGFFQKIPPINGNSHFENLQSTNWNTLRFKNPPSAESKIGWRVEFRPLDI